MSVLSLIRDYGCLLLLNLPYSWTINVDLELTVLALGSSRDKTLSEPLSIVILPLIGASSV